MQLIIRTKALFSKNIAYDNTIVYVMYIIDFHIYIFKNIGLKFEVSNTSFASLHRAEKTNASLFANDFKRMISCFKKLFT